MPQNETIAHDVLMSIFVRIGPDEWTADDCRHAADDVLSEIRNAGWQIVKWPPTETTGNQR